MLDCINKAGIIVQTPKAFRTAALVMVMSIALAAATALTAGVCVAWADEADASECESMAASGSFEKSLCDPDSIDDEGQFLGFGEQQEISLVASEGQVTGDGESGKTSSVVDGFSDVQEEPAIHADIIAVSQGEAGTIENASQDSMEAPMAIQAKAIDQSIQSSAVQGQITKTGSVADGDYYIRANTATRLVLDVMNGSSLSGANVQLYSFNGTNAQKWHLKYDAKSDAYTITSLISGMALDVTGASTRNGVNVQVFAPNGTKAQQWKIVTNGTGWRIESALKSGFVLDVFDAGSSNGTNVQGYISNGTNAQRFDLLALSPNVSASTANIAEGVYVIKGAASGKVLDVSGGSRNQTANVQQYVNNSTYAQRFYFEPDGTGFYRIFNMGSGLALDVSGAGKMPGTNVRQYEWNGTAAQLWSVRVNPDKTYTFVSKANGLVLDISGASNSDGANVQMWISNGTKAQEFTLSASELLTAGVVKLYSSASPEKAIAVQSSSTSLGASMQISNQSGVAQKLLATKVGDGYAFRPVCSGLYVSPSDSEAIQSDVQTVWTVAFAKTGTRRGIVLMSPERQALTTSSTSNGAALNVAPASNSVDQSFCPEHGLLIDSGTYIIVSAVGNKVIDAANGKRVNRTNIQIYVNNGTNSQKYKFTSVGGDWYTIQNASSRRALDVADGSTASGANVQLYTLNGTNAQKWKAELQVGGYFRFVNACSGKVLDVAGAKDANGVNVQVYDGNSTKAQQFKVVSTVLAREGVDLEVPSVWQNPELPTGCESVALTNVLKYYGYSLGKTEIADNYMTWSGSDFVYSFMGNPHTSYGAAIMAPGITNAANRYLSAKGSELRASNITGTSFDNLYSYIDAGIPVVVWSTMYFGDRGSAQASQDGYTMYGNTHSVTLAGYNASKSQVLVSDPLSGSVWRDASRFKYLYDQMGRQAVVIQ